MIILKYVIHRGERWNVLGLHFAWPGCGSGGGSTGEASVRKCQKLLSCPAELIAAGFKRGMPWSRLEQSEMMVTPW